MRKSIITVLSAVMLILLLQPVAISAKVPINIKPDDSFRFVVSGAKSSYMINSTEFSDGSLYDNDTSIGIVVTDTEDIDDDTASSVFRASNTYVNFTEEIGENEPVANSSFVDGWQEYIGSYLFYSALLLAFSGYPNSYNFEEPEDTNLVERSTEIRGFPYFVTSNVSFYEELEEEFEDLDDTFTADTITADTDASLSDNQEMFQVNYNFLAEDTENNTNSEIAKYVIQYDFEIEADLTRSILTHFYFYWYFEVSIGDASSILETYLIVDEGSGLLGNINLPVDVPYPALWIVMPSLFLIPLLRKKWNF